MRCSAAATAAAAGQCLISFELLIFCRRLDFRQHSSFKSVFCVFQVSTHGYSQNQILVWKYPSLTQVAKLTGHSYRVLYLVSVRSVFIHFSMRYSSLMKCLQIGSCTESVGLLYLQRLTESSMQAMSPDGEAIVTGAGDETLRFWNVFSKMRSTKVMFPCIMFLISPSLSAAGHLTPFLICRNPCRCWTSSPGSGSEPLLCLTGGMNPGRSLVFACVQL